MKVSRTWWAVVAVLLACAAAPFVVRVEPPEPPGGWHVNVRWAPGVTDAHRADLEEQHGLIVLQPHAERTWVYRLRRSDADTIRALVTDPRVEDTHGIDRSAFRLVTPRITLIEHVTGERPDAVERLADAFSARGIAACLLAVVALLGLRRPSVRATLASRMPALSPGGLGLYRAALGVALIAIAITATELPETAFPRELHRSQDWFADWSWVHLVASRPSLDDWIVPACVVLLAAFSVGILARASYAASVALLTVHVLVALQHKSAHDWGLPLVTLWGLTLVPWHKGIGVLRRAGSGAENFGFAIWFPGLTIGLAFAAAAFAKLDSSGIAWIAGGAVKYHFIEDAYQAPTDWGLRIAANPSAAVAMSAGAILVESLFILNVFFRSPWVRAAFGVAGLALLAGFRLMQGIEWFPWWALFLAFVPWQPIARALFRDDRATVNANARIALHPRAAAVVAALVAVQIVASGYRIEAEPFISDYGMYSWTWPSRDAFDAQIARKYRRYGFRRWSAGGAGEDVTERFRAMPKAADLLADVVDHGMEGEGVAGDRRAALAALAAGYRDTFGEPAGRLLVVVDEQAFDWTRGRFYVKSDDRAVGILDVEAGEFTSGAGGFSMGTR